MHPLEYEFEFEDCLKMVALTGRQAELKMEKIGIRGTVQVDRQRGKVEMVLDICRGGLVELFD